MEREWIEHFGSENPIPWAKAGEFMIMLRLFNGERVARIDAAKLRWTHIDCGGDILAYRLTNGWAPVLNGVLPEHAISWSARECELRWFDGNITRPISRLQLSEYWKYWSCETPVAVRLIKQPKVHISKQGLAIAWSEKDRAYMPVAAHVDEPIESTVYQPDGYAFVGSSPAEIRKIETEKQRLTREASTKYFAKLHAKSEPYRSLTDDAINDIAAAALREHDRVWARRG